MMHGTTNIIYDAVVDRVFGGVQTAVRFLDNKSSEIVAKKIKYLLQ